MAIDMRVPRNKIDWPVEAIDESVVGTDLDGDGKTSSTIKRLKALPKTFVGDAKAIKLNRSLYPVGTEFLHSVRYVDPDAPTLLSTRMKELRYARKLFPSDRGARLNQYRVEQEDRENGMLPQHQGDPAVGMLNDFGWRYQGFIEDARGRLRAQTHQEHTFCMGCHGYLGVTLDESFSFPRKVPGRDGWKHQDLAGIPDVPQWGHKDPEILTYFRRVHGGDEFRANTEIIERFFETGVDGHPVPIEPTVRQAAPGGDKDIAFLLAPSRQRALDLNRAYMALMRTQTFEQGRDAILNPPKNVFEKIEGNQATALDKSDRIFTDGTLRLDWRQTRFFGPND